LSAENVNGGDQLASILTFLLVPLALTDPRQSHWGQLAPDFKPGLYRSLLAWWSIWLIRLQVCYVYLHAFVGKLKVPEWVDGSVLYYWVNDPVFGAPSPLRETLTYILLNGTFASCATWMVLGLEFVLAAAIISKAHYRPWIWVVGVFFHTLTVFVHGIPSFALVMTAALILYLLPLGRSLTLQFMTSTRL
jgi:antimicrobial peptide system SdpB family protein